MKDLTVISLELQQKQEHITNLESTLERIQSDRPDSKAIVAAIESEKVAASRAVAQNQELKKQLDEIQLAFIQIVSKKV